MQKELSVIIVNYNVRFFLEQCLRSVEAAAEGIDCEIIVADNHSTDGSIEYLRPQFPDVLFIENKDNPGFSKANNQAINQSKGKYILILNPDTIVGENTLKRLRSFMEQHSEAGAIGVKMINGQGRFLPESKRSFPTPWVSFCKLFGISKLFPYSKQFARYGLLYLDPDKPHPVEVLAGAFLFTKKEVLEKTGLFDETFFMYGEDIDLSYRIHSAGYTNYYLPERILHYKGESTKHHELKYIKAFYEAMLIFYKKYYPKARIMRVLVKSAVELRIRWEANVPKKEPQTNRMKKQQILILCPDKDYADIQAACLEHFPESSYSGHSTPTKIVSPDNLDQEISANNWTDIVFSYPDFRFEQILQFMDKNRNKKITYHIYHPKNKRIVSPGK